LNPKAHIAQQEALGVEPDTALATHSHRPGVPRQVQIPPSDDAQRIWYLSWERGRCHWFS
jgi:hypothetical protein